MSGGRSGNPHGARWLGRRWTNWAMLEDVLDRSVVPRQPGVYRLRGKRFTGLLYVGESGNLHERLIALRHALGRAADGKTEKTGHWAAQNLHMRLKGRKLVVSWLKDAVPAKSERKGIECECIAAHRWHLDRNPDCQFVSLEQQ